MHYTGVPLQTPEGAWRYFNDPDKTLQSGAHFCIGFDGSIYQLWDSDHVAFHAGDDEYTPWFTSTYPSYATNQQYLNGWGTPNWCSVGVEVCHCDATGQWSERAMKSAIWLAKKLINDYHLSMANVCRHYDITRKVCPKYYVEHPQAWGGFKRRLR